jgi:class 3 adenylate cyclase
MVKKKQNQKLNFKDGDHITAFAMVIDINHFAGMVRNAKNYADSISQFTRDVLTSAIMQIEANGGRVVGLMGDAILAIIEEGEAAVKTCFCIARDVDRQCEYISSAQNDCRNIWGYAPGGPTLKIAVEYGDMDVSEISSECLGEQKLFVGDAVVYADRISRAGNGNRCILGPVAAKTFRNYGIEGPFFILGKRGEPRYKYYHFPMGEIWKEGVPGKETYWG